MIGSWTEKRAATLLAFAVVAIMSLSMSPVLAQTAARDNTTYAGSASDSRPYKLDSGDKVKVTIYGEDDLSGEFSVDGSGNVRLPLIGQVRAAGLTQHEFEEAVAAQLAHGFLINPRVSVEVTSYRPFSILGEVNKPGEYPFENGMTVLNAVAIGGGYTYRADKSDVYIRRKGAASEAKFPADDTTLVYPGDTVRVDERIF